ncbi:MAG: CRISPR-associated endonuclease Cas2 [Candidatus Zambryskibacteria bacterium RIFCSPHIGHO2_01_FULL_46_30]|uniref:Repressor in ring oxydation complex/ phenylacetic acid degradation pathway related protein (PaaX) n=2 Tax=Parcubacteria group TaxID=1794811 RepID=A0A837IK89_9BACT|nr:MAG: Repressor in ring oxydation complex/ phenylacetic acid degradation pathway related protein (PaaX) [Candidatus Yanofskybacteria bacterium GW2011_GWC1_48_11]OHA91102.1 MAG: CRISPR-associated endonuclease Cas2 [Candidatus Zambryskibacteria bacterium RIFCSPHIGHO2_01_FULL_46_30]OHB05819.1 MAG: CRISPR-associated endonuclease Cas2 [Candidatus Zambryskibacteria bacterium RIFCSPLOWO2_01_FULL_47_33]
MTRKGAVQKKVASLLLAGVALSLTRSGKKQLRIIKDVRNEWREIDSRALKAAIKSLYSSKLISQKNNKDGTTTFELSKEGKRVALTYDIDNMKILKQLWDKKWRIVIFDIPEKLKKIREALRHHLKQLGFIELQHSVFVLPFECQNEIEYITEFYNIRRFVRYIEAHHIDNELDLKHKFNLL